MENKYFARLSLLTASLIAVSSFFDPFVSYNGLSWHYLPVRAFIVFSFLALYFLSRKRKVPTLLSYDLFGYLLYFLAFYGMIYIGPSYTFCFMHCFIAVAINTQTTPKRFAFQWAIGCILCVLGHYFTPQPRVVVTGVNLKLLLCISALMSQLISGLIYIFVTRYRLKINELTEKYALIGKKSSFLIHEIRTPLSRVYSQTHQNESHELLQSINSQTNRILSLIDGVETLIYHPHRLKETFNHFSLQEIKRELLHDFSSYLQAMNIDFKFDIEDETIEVFGNRNLIYQMLKNIITNAIEAIGYQENTRPYIHLISKSIGDKTILIIKNSHSFIPKNSIRKIFEANFSTKPQPTNKGLGLTLAKSIVEVHKGRIQVNSHNDFTEFEITLNSLAMQV